MLLNMFKAQGMVFIFFSCLILSWYESDVKIDSDHIGFENKYSTCDSVIYKNDSYLSQLSSMDRPAESCL